MPSTRNNRTDGPGKGDSGPIWQEKHRNGPQNRIFRPENQNGPSNGNEKRISIPESSKNHQTGMKTAISFPIHAKKRITRAFERSEGASAPHRSVSETSKGSRSSGDAGRERSGGRHVPWGTAAKRRGGKTKGTAKRPAQMRRPFCGPSRA